jgi:hypothetical protein
MSPTSSRFSRRTSMLTAAPVASGDIFAERDSIVALMLTLFLFQAMTSTVPERL